MAHNRKAFLTCGVAAIALTMASVSAQAGAFFLKEQSTEGTGLATAGAAAGGAGLGSIFWNPAALSKYDGFQAYTAITGILPNGQNKGTAATYGAFGLNSGNIGQDTVLPSSAYSYQVNDRLWVGLSLTTPYGLETRNPVSYAGSPFAIHSKIISYNANPMVAYKINDWLTFAVGLQFQYGKVLLTQGVPSIAPFTPTAAVAELKGDGYGAGVTAGLLLTPMAGTDIGLGYRSSIKTNMQGNFRVQALGLGLPATFDPDTADIFTAGLRQRITNDFDLLAGFEYDHWKLGNLPVNNLLTGTQIVTALGPVSIPFNFKDGWMTSLGGEYHWSSVLTLRAGAAYERAPIDDTNRRPSLPEGDRIWTSVGLGYKLTVQDTIDVGYSHLFVKNGNVNVSIPNTPIAYVGTTQGSVDLVSLAWNHRFDTPTAPVLRAKY